MNPRLALIASLLASPAFASFRCPARGGAAWREYRTKHFIVDTDGGAQQAQAFLRQLEHMYGLVLQALVGEQLELPGRVRVLALADQTDFTEIAGQRNVDGYYTTNTLFGEPTILLPLRILQDNPEGVAHEIAHHVSYFLFPVQPHWLREGLAEWVQTVAALPAEKAMAHIGSHIVHGAVAMSGGMAGSIPVNLVSWLNFDSRPMPAVELLAWDGRDRDTAGARGHLWSWVLYHWLWNERSKAFADYQKRLADSADPQAAWRAAFPEFDPASKEAMAKLDDELDRYRRRGRFAFFKVEAESDTRFTESDVSSTDLHLMHFMVRDWPREASQREELQRAVLDEALAEDPGNPVALYVHMRWAKQVDVSALRAAVNARPRDWRGWLELGRAAEEEIALRKAVELNPDNANAQNDLAWALVKAGRAHDALPIANRALDLAPWDPIIVDTLAEVAARLGKCREALQLEERAVATSPDLRKRQAAIAQRCAVVK